MARQPADRENLLREATALVERIELAPRQADEPRHVTAGFRANGSASIFFGDDPVYQFNVQGELRRAYRGGLVFKAERGRLVALRRVRQQKELQLVRHELPDAEQEAFLAELGERLRGFEAELAQDGFTVVGQVPESADVLNRLRDWLARHRADVVAQTPRV